MSAAARRRRRPARRPTRKDGALVLRRFPYGESSLLVHLLTPAHGRVVALAKGAYRPTSGYCGVLDLFDELEVEWHANERSEVGVLRGASLRRRRRGITADLERYETACACLELAGLGARDEQAEPALFGHTNACLQALHEGRLAPRLLAIAFDLGFLGVLGLEPALEHCAACGTDLRSDRRRAVEFHARSGGRLCERCAAEARRTGLRVETLPRPVLRIANSIRGATIESLERVHLEAALLRDLETFVRGFVETHLETRPRARRGGLPGRPSSRLATGAPGD